MNHRFIALLAGLACLLLSSSLFAFDGNRKGFVFGTGLGAGHTSIDRTIEVTNGAEEGRTDDGFGLATRLQVGYGTSQQSVYAFETRTQWFGAKYQVGYADSRRVKTTNVMAVFGGPTLSYYLNPAVPSLFIGGGPTIVFVTDELNMTILGSGPRNLDAWGPGLVLKCGYEFSRHFDISFEFVAGFPGETTAEEDMSSTLLGFAATINWLGY